MESTYSADCNLCNGDGLVVGFKGGEIRCSSCFPGRGKDDINRLSKFDYAEQAGTFDEDEYDGWQRNVRSEMRREPAFLAEEHRRRAVEKQKSVEIAKQTAERLAGVFKQ